MTLESIREESASGCMSCVSYGYSSGSMGGDYYPCTNKKSPYQNESHFKKYGGTSLDQDQERDGCDSHVLKKG